MSCGPMTWKGTSNQPINKFSPENVNYCQDLLDYMSTVDPCKIKCFGEAGFNIPDVANPNYDHSVVGEPCTEVMYQSIPKPPIPLPPTPTRAIPRHLTRVKLRTVGNLTQNEARPVGHLTFVSKRLSAIGSRRILHFFDTAREPRSRVIALVDSTFVFLLLSFYIVISWNMPLFKARSEEKLNKKFVVAENFVCIKGRALLTF